MKQRFPHMVSTRQIRQSVRRSIEVILESVTSNVMVPRQNTLGRCERAGTHKNREPDDGKSLLAARARLNAVAQWHSRWEYPWVKLGGNENMKGVPGMFTHPMLDT